MTTNQIGTLHSPNGLGFGLGFQTTDRVRRERAGLGGRVSGGPARTRRCTASIREARLVIVLMIQMLPNTTDIGRKFPTLVYQALTEKLTEKM